MPSCIFPGLEFDSPRSRFGRHLQKYVTPQMSSIIQKVKLKDLIGVEQTHTHTHTVGSNYREWEATKIGPPKWTFH